jgi:hypothetical protein
MEYLGTLKTENCKDLGISYLKGILNTFGALNQPDSNLSYDYNIVKVEKKDGDLIESIKSNFEVFSTQLIKLDLITDELFKSALKGWLFETKYVSDYRIECETNFVFNLIKEIADYQNLYIINGLDSTTFSYDFGIYYEYFFLEGSNDSHIIYFSYSD